MRNYIIKIGPTIPIIIFCVFTFLFYGPLSVYLPNAEEIWFDLGTMLKVVALFSLFSLILILCFFLILPKSVTPFFQKLLFGVSLALYVQGNWVSSKYGTGVLDGSQIAWEEYKGYAIGNLILWLACILLPFVASALLNKKKKKELVTKMLVIGAIFLTVIQIPALVSQLFTYHPNTNAELKISTDGMFEISETENVFFIVLDAMDEEYYETFIQEHPEYEKELTGFVHFDNTLASGARTMIAVPSMLTGRPFTRDSVYSDFLDQVWGAENALSLLADNGYDVRVYADSIGHCAKEATYVSNFTLDGNNVSSYKKLLKKIYKLDLYKFAPHVLKQRFWFNTSEFEAAKDNVSTFARNDPQFFQDFRANGFIVNRKKKSFIMYHINGAHSPYTMNAEMKKAESTREEQVEGCFKGLKEMFDDLKGKGLYDSATILVLGDHGDVELAQKPLLMVKEKGCLDSYRTSHAPASLFDAAVYLASLTGKKLENQPYGEELFKLREDQERERHFFQNTSGNSRVVVKEYVTYTGTDAASLEQVNTYDDPEGMDTPYTLGTELTFLTDATANRYTVDGFGTNTGFRTIMRGPVSTYILPIADAPDTGELGVHIRLHKLTKSGLDLHIYVGGEELFQAETGEKLVKSGINFSVPVELLDEEDRLVIEFRFPEISEDQMEIDVQKRRQTLSVISIIVE